MAHLIDKAALVAEIERKKISFKKDIDNGIYPTYLCALMDFEDFIDTLEVKEVDLEKEIAKYLGDNWMEDTPTEVQEDMINYAKHFFELGLKAQIGE